MAGIPRRADVAAHAATRIVVDEGDARGTVVRHERVLPAGRLGGVRRGDDTLGERIDDDEFLAEATSRLAFGTALALHVVVTIIAPALRVEALLVATELALDALGPATVQIDKHHSVVPFQNVDNTDVMKLHHAGTEKNRVLI